MPALSGGVKMSCEWYAVFLIGVAIKLFLRSLAYKEKEEDKEKE